MKDNENLLDSLLLIKRRLVDSLVGNQKGAAAFASDLGQRVEEEAATLSRLHLDKTHFNGTINTSAEGQNESVLSRGGCVTSLDNSHGRGSVNCQVRRQNERGTKTWADLRIGATDG